jgi:chaperonin GroEL
MRGQAVLSGDDARAALVRGLAAMAAAVAPTLGPTARTVAVAPIGGSGPPEVLDDAATIARRTIAIGDPFENMGAMLLRHVVWRVHEAVGDGGATAAVLARQLIEDAVNYVAAGGDPLALGRGIERASQTAIAALCSLARPIEFPREVAATIAGSVPDRAVALLLGEALEAVGADGVLLVRDGHSADTECEFVEGVRWDAGCASPYLLADDRATATLDDPLLLVTDLTPAGADDLVPALDYAVEVGRPLLIVAPSVHDAALAVIVANRERGLLAVKAPASSGAHDRALEEVALMVGARLFSQAHGDRLRDLQPADLGAARQAWATRGMTGLIGGRGDRAAIRARLAEVRAELERAENDDARAKLRDRIGRLAGIAAIVRVGGRTTRERDERKLRVEAAIASGRAALREGVVPGGGCGLIFAARAIERLDFAGDEAVGARLVARALEAPLRTMADNAGVENATIVHDAYRLSPDLVYDAVRQEWVDPWGSGILDAFLVVRRVIETSVSSAVTTLSTETLVRGPAPSVAATP